METDTREVVKEGGSMFLVKIERLWAAIEKLRSGREATVVQTCSLTKEVAWRLRQIASQMGCSPGEVVEVLISPTVKGVRLSWDTVGRVAMGLIPASECPLESQESDGDGSVETLPIGEGVTSSDQQNLIPTPGTGEGGKRPPAPAAPKRGPRARAS